MPTEIAENFRLKFFFLFGGNALGHNATVVRQFLTTKMVTALTTLYSLDLSSQDHFLFLKIKMHPEGQKFDTIPGHIFLKNAMKMLL